MAISTPRVERRPAPSLPPPQNGGLLQRVGQLLGGGQQVVKEIIGRITYYVPFWPARIWKNVDKTQTDYMFWDNLRRCKAKGFEIAGLFCIPICQIITSWTLGFGWTPKLTQKPADPDNEDDPVNYTNSLLDKFTQRIQGLMMTVQEDDLALGDQYVIVNIDGSLSVPSPETVEVFHEDLDYRKPTRYVVTTKIEGAEIKDEYRLDGRTLSIKRDGDREATVYEYANLIGRLPVVHWPNDKSANEIYGRPVYEPLYRLLSRWDDLFNKAVDAGEIMGNPIPTISGVEDIDETIDANATQDPETYFDSDGNPEQRKSIKFDTRAMMIVGKGGMFSFTAPPGGFTGDIVAILTQMYHMIMLFTRIPEYMLGWAITASHASTETQTSPFGQYIEFRRIKFEGEGSDEELGMEANGGLLELYDIWLRTKRLTNPKIVVGPTYIDWPELDPENEQIKLQWANFAAQQGYLPPEEGLELTNLVEDSQKTIAKARKEEPLPLSAAGVAMAQANAAAAAQQSANPTPPTPDSNNGKPNTIAIKPVRGGNSTRVPQNVPATPDGDPSWKLRSEN